MGNELVYRGIETRSHCSKSFPICILTLKIPWETLKLESWKLLHTWTLSNCIVGLCNGLNALIIPFIFPFFCFQGKFMSQFYQELCRAKLCGTKVKKSRGRENIFTGTWNVMIVRPAGKLEELTHEIERYHRNMLSLCEELWLGVFCWQTQDLFQ